MKIIFSVPEYAGYRVKCCVYIIFSGRIGTATSDSILIYTGSGMYRVLLNMDAGLYSSGKTEKQFIGIKLIYNTEIYRQSRAKHGDIVVQIISNLSLSLI